MIKSWQPLLDRLLVKQDPAPTLHPNSGLEIPEAQREDFRPHTGTIVAVGPGTHQNGVFCKVALVKGQHVMFANPDMLTKVEHDGGEHLMMREQDVFLVLDGQATKDAGQRARQFRIGEPYAAIGEQGVRASLMMAESDASYRPKDNDQCITGNGFVFTVKVQGTKLTCSPVKAAAIDGFLLDLMRHANSRAPIRAVEIQ